MRRLFIFTILSLASTIAVTAQSRSQQRYVEQTARKIGEAEDLGKLDNLGLISGRVRIVIEHSISEDPQFEVKRFRSFRAAERWLANRQRDGLPTRISPPLESCGRGACTFDLNGGILHNHLYKRKILYGYQGNRLYIKALYFLDGD